MKPILIILGMHRSGTSLLTRVCNLLGADLGEHLMKPGPDNPKGFWEHSTIQRLNDEMLQRAGVLWDDPAPLPNGWHHDPDVKVLGEALRDVLAEEFTRLTLPAVKDPRICRLLPVWQSVLASLGWQPKYLMVARSPIEVGQSLFRRNALLPARSYLLWARYNVEGERLTRGTKRALITYDELLTNWHSVLRPAYRNLGIDWPAEDTDYRSPIDAFVDPSLRHQKISDADAFGVAPLPRSLLSFYSAWSARESHKSSAGCELGAAADDLQRMLMLFDGALSGTRRTRVNCDALLERIADLEQLASRTEELNTTLAARDRENLRLNRQVDELLGSRSWRLLAPIRATARTARAILSKLKQGLPRSPSSGSRSGSFPSYPRQGNRSARSANVVMASAPPLRLREVPRRYEPLRFDDTAAPSASVIIPVFNHGAYTYNCLASLCESVSSCEFEVIVVDDGSTDETPIELARQVNVRFVRHEEQRGYIASCNAGAKIAKAQHLIFLNNDTQVQEGWLDALIGTFATKPDAGLVGSQLIYPDGRLQEAGGIVWRDGSAWNLGRFGDRHAPEFNYLRAVDYCSGASIAVPRDLFTRLQGFDEHYAPAYYEDTDLAFRIRALGSKVYYQPASKVVHFEGITSGTDAGDTGEVKRFQPINREKFVQRWRDALARHRPRGEQPELEKERNVFRRVLLCDRRMITPDRDSGSLRTDQILDLLQELGFKVTFAPMELMPRQPHLQRLQSRGIECLYTPYVTSVAEHIRQHGALYDAVILCRADVADALMPAVRAHCPDARVIFDTVDLHFLRQRREARLKKDRLLMEAARARELQERKLITQSDICFVVSAAEKELLLAEMPDAHIQVLSNIHPVIGRTRGFDERQGLLFIGGFRHPPNVDAVLYFARDVLPLVRELIPDIEFIVVGDAPPEQIRALDDVTIRIAGHVANLGPWLERCRLTVAPLRYGAGVKGKVNSSLAHGVPVVGTSIAFEGMFAVHGESAIIADSAQEMAAAICQVHGDKDLWQRLSDAGLKLTAEHFSAKAARRVLAASLSNLSARRQPIAEPETQT